MPPNKKSDLPERQIINWTIVQNEQSEIVFGWNKSNKELDENGQEKGLLVYTIGFLTPDPDFQIAGELNKHLDNC
jgi:hypothetical protein